MFKNIPFNRVEWVTSSFLIITAILTFTAVPAYFYFFGWDWCLVLYLLSNGPIAFAQSASLILGSNGASSTDAIYRQYNLIGLKRVLPFWRFTVLTIQSGKEWAVGARFLLYLKLVAFNLKNLCKEFRIVRQILAKINNK